MQPAAKAPRIDASPASSISNPAPLIYCLPREILKIIFEYLGILDLKRCTLTCHRFRKIANEEIYQYPQFEALVRPENYRCWSIGINSDCSIDRITIEENTKEELTFFSKAILRPSKESLLPRFLKFNKTTGVVEECTEPKKIPPHGDCTFRRKDNILEVMRYGKTYDLQLPPRELRNPYDPHLTIVNAFYVQPNKVVAFSITGVYIRWNLSTGICDRVSHLKSNEGPEAQFHMEEISGDYLFFSLAHTQGTVNLGYINLNSPETIKMIPDSAAHGHIRKYGDRLYAVFVKPGSNSSDTSILRMYLTTTLKFIAIANAFIYVGGRQNLIVSYKDVHNNQSQYCVFDLQSRTSVANRVDSGAIGCHVFNKVMVVFSKMHNLDFYNLPSLRKFSSINLKSIGFPQSPRSFEIKYINDKFVLAAFDVTKSKFCFATIKQRALDHQNTLSNNQKRTFDEVK